MSDRGIDSVGLNKQIANIEYYMAEIKTELNAISGYMDTIKTYYKGNGADKLIGSYANTKSRYGTMFSKLELFKNELNNNITAYKSQSEAIYTEVSSTPE